MVEFEKMILENFARLGMTSKVLNRVDPDPLHFGNQFITYAIGDGIIVRFVLDRSQVLIDLSPSNQNDFYSYIDIAKVLGISASSQETTPWEEILEQIMKNKPLIAKAFAAKNWVDTKEKILTAAHDRMRWLY